MVRIRSGFLWLTGLGWWRLLLAAIVIAILVVLFSVRPWSAPKYDCVVTVRPGESIQEAIDAAEAGAAICLTPGVWNENVVIDKSLSIVGAGVGRTTIEAVSYFDPTIEVLADDTGAMNVKLEGLTITGGGGSSGVQVNGSASVAIERCDISGKQFGVQVFDSASVALTDCSISENTHRGLVLEDSATADVSGCRISGNGALGVWISGSAEATLRECDMSGNGGHGFWLRDGARVALIDCLVSRNRGHGLWLTDQSTAQLLRTEISESFDQGVMAEDSVSVELTESEVLSNWNGIELSSEATATIAGSTFSGSRFDGIRVQHSANAMVSTSTISANRRGMSVTGQAAATITDSLVEANSGYGIYCWSSERVQGHDNGFRDNGTDLGGNLPGTLRTPLKDPSEAVITWPDERYASLQEAIDALLPGGTLLLEEGGHTAGLTIGKELSIEAVSGQVPLTGMSRTLPVLSLVDGANLYLSGAKVSGGAEGLLISAGARAVLVGCSISGNTEGVRLSYSSSVEMADCLVSQNEQRGITVGAEAQASIEGCIVSDNWDSGIAVSDSAQVSVAYSTVTKNRGDGGIVFWGRCRVTLDGNTVADNRGYGVAMLQRPCVMRSPWVWRGVISGAGNTIELNYFGDVCPPELEFLSTTEGGELDLRP